MKTKKSTFRLVALAAALAVLQGCGGGSGGGGGYVGPLPSSSSGSPTRAGLPPQTVIPTTPTTPAEPSAEDLALVAGAEAVTFTVTNPQAGSTAEVGADWEGIFESSSGDGYTFIAPSRVAGEGPFLARRGATAWTFGIVDLGSTVTWTFDPDRMFRFPDVGDIAGLTGSGSFGSKSSMLGFYSTEGGSQTVWGPLRYSLSNALAITLADLQGTWKSRSGTSITFAADGTFTGATTGQVFNACILAGKVEQVSAASAGKKNLFYLTLAAAVDPAASEDDACALDTEAFYGGLSAVLLTPAGDYHSNGYFRTFGLHALNEHAAVMTAFLDKVQP